MQIYNPILITNKSFSFESLIAAVDHKNMKLGKVEMLPLRHGTHEWLAQVASEGIYIAPYFRIRHAELKGPILKFFEHVPIPEKKVFYFIFTEEFIDTFISTLQKISIAEAWVNYKDLGDRGEEIAMQLEDFLKSNWVEKMRCLIKHG